MPDAASRWWWLRRRLRGLTAWVLVVASLLAFAALFVPEIVAPVAWWEPWVPRIVAPTETRGVVINVTPAIVGAVCAAAAVWLR